MTITRDQPSKALRLTVKILENHRTSLTAQDVATLDQIRTDLSGTLKADDVMP